LLLQQQRLGRQIVVVYIGSVCGRTAFRSSHCVVVVGVTSNPERTLISMFSLVAAVTDLRPRRRGWAESNSEGEGEKIAARRSSSTAWTTVRDRRLSAARREQRDPSPPLPPTTSDC
jgi:hypothetical protein